MYQNLLFAVKTRILDEIQDAFNEYPNFSEKVKIYHKYPYEERIQYGVVLRNTSASQVRMSADNYLADISSHARLARQSNYPGLAIEWVRENTLEITKETEEDVSNQVGPTQRRIITNHQICAGGGDTRFADNIGQVIVKIDGEQVFPEFVDGKTKIIMLRDAPLAGSVVKVHYFYRNIVNPGIYVIDFTEDNQFVVGPIFIIEEEVVIEGASGTETSASLDHNLIYPSTEELYLKSKNGGNPIILRRDTDYSIDYSTGDITFLNPLEKNFDLLADYRYQPGYSWGPFTFRPYQEIHDALNGVVICIGDRAKKGDQQLIVTSQFREPQARIYGGHWDMSLEVAVVAKDPIQMGEMADHLVNYLWGKRKNALEFEGITLASVEPGGETEESFIDLTGDLYYETSIGIMVMTEWQEFVPYFFKIDKIPVNLIEILEADFSNYLIDQNNNMVYTAVTADMRHVRRYGTKAYEKVS